VHLRLSSEQVGGTECSFVCHVSRSTRQFSGLFFCPSRASSQCFSQASKHLLNERCRQSDSMDFCHFPRAHLRVDSHAWPAPLVLLSRFQFISAFIKSGRVRGRIKYSFRGPQEYLLQHNEVSQVQPTANASMA